jgi:hypothetical protein
MTDIGKYSFAKVSYLVYRRWQTATAAKKAFIQRRCIGAELTRTRIESHPITFLVTQTCGSSAPNIVQSII